MGPAMPVVLEKEIRREKRVCHDACTADEEEMCMRHDERRQGGGTKDKQFTQTAM